MTQSTARAYVKRECARLGAKLGNDAVGIHYEIRAEAPSRMVWTCSKTHEIISATLGAYDWVDIAARIKQGVQPCEDNHCEWCTGV